jgi:hypothetical protein
MRFCFLLASSPVHASVSLWPAAFHTNQDLRHSRRRSVVVYVIPLIARWTASITLSILPRDTILLWDFVLLGADSEGS